MTDTPHFRPVSDHALLIELGTEVDERLGRAIVALDRAIARARIEGVEEVVPALVNLLVVFDPVVTDHARVGAALARLFPLDPADEGAGRRHDIAVCYDEGLAPDLPAVARARGMSEEAVIAAHLGAEYRVGMYGFAPGYAYLSGVPEAIRVPRKAAPVRDIPAGSVMIAGAQCLTTTLRMPTGWSIIGRSDARIITGDPERPFLFDVGDTVTFHRVTRAALSEAAP